MSDVLEKEINGASRYLIRSDGTVIGRRSPRTRNCQDCRRTLSGCIHDGYRRYAIKMDNGKVRHVFAHVLVLEAFVGKRPKGMDACHLDCNRQNNSLSNLRWGTRKENISDSIKLGRHQHGERSAHSKLTNDMVREIRDKVADGMGFREAGRKYGVTHMTIHYAFHRKTWGHVA